MFTFKQYLNEAAHTPERYKYVIHKTLSNITKKGMQHNDAFHAAAEDENLHGMRKDIVKHRERVIKILNKHHGTNITKDLHLKEDQEINELSKKTLGSYISKATKDRAKWNKAYETKTYNGRWVGNLTASRKGYNRSQGLEMAKFRLGKKLTKSGKEYYDKKLKTNPGLSKLTKESEEINELSSKTLKSYVKKSARDYGINRADKALEATSKGSAHTKAGIELDRVGIRRLKGITRALDRLK